MDIGARLQTSREQHGYSIAHVAAALRIQPRYLIAIERNDCSILPPRPYGRGFVRAYAVHLGENPEQTVHDFFGQFEPPAPAVPVVKAAPAPRKTMPVYEGAQTGIATVVLLCVGVAIVLAFAMRRSAAPAPATVPQQAVGTAGTGAPAITGNTGSAQVQSTTDAPADGVAVDLEATAPAWVTASVDGTRAVYRTMQPGEHEKLRGRGMISVRVGNAGAVRWVVNGRPAEMMGAAGAVRSVRVSAE